MKYLELEVNKSPCASTILKNQQEHKPIIDKVISWAKNQALADKRMPNIIDNDRDNKKTIRPIILKAYVHITCHAVPKIEPLFKSVNLEKQQKYSKA